MAALEYLGPLCSHVCPSCGGCVHCCNGNCHVSGSGYQPQEDPNE